MPNSQWSTARTPAALQHRQRLQEGMAMCLAQKGYVDTTIAEIAAAARVSKRTFYEHFTSKQECLIALYQEAISAGMKALHQAAGSCGPDEDAVEVGIRAFSQHLADHELVARAAILGVMSMGIEGLKLRRDAHQELVVAMAHYAGVDIALVPPMVLEGIVGVLVELMLVAFERGTLADLPTYAPQAAMLMRTALESAQARGWTAQSVKTPVSPSLANAAGSTSR